MKTLSKLLRFLTVYLVCFSSANAQKADNSDAKNSVPVFKNGEAQIVPGFNASKDWIKHELWVETNFDSDGDSMPDRMHVFVTRPWQTDSSGLKLPVVYISSPYYSGVGGNSKSYFWDVKQELGEIPKPHEHPEVKRKEKRPLMTIFDDRTWVPRGYIMVYSCSPGTGFSDGSPTVGGENESLAPKAVIDWLCGRADGYTTQRGNEKVTAYWCTGKVGMTGTSYNGTLALAAASTGVEGLEAIIPIAPNTSYYHYYRSNGLVRSPGGYLGEDVDVLYDFIHSGDESKRAFSNANVRDKILEAGQDRVTGDYNEFWASRDYLNQLEHMKAAIFMSHGFNDWNVMPEHSYRIYKAVKDKGLPTQLYYNQGGHGDPPPTHMMNRWFTRYLHGIENGVENDPEVWIVREHEYFPTAYKEYPDDNALPVCLYLKSGNPARGELSTVKTENKVTETLIDNYKNEGKELAKAKSSDHRLLYVTPILTKDIRISGIPKVSIKMSCSKPAANLSVWLVSLPWDGGLKSKIYDNIITRGWADPQNHRSLTNGEPLDPGKFYDITFDLMPDDQIIPKGQQIGLMIFSSDKEFTLWPEPGTELTIDLNSTTITLPIVGGTEVFNRAFME